jgi:serine O-acetyltransferase
VIKDVPPNSTAVGIPARVGIGFTKKEIEELEHGKLPDPVAEAIKFLAKQIEELEARIRNLEKLEGIKAEIDKYLEEKKKQILRVFTPLTGFNEGAGI